MTWLKDLCDHVITENFHFPKYRHTAANIRLTKYWMEHTIGSGTLRFSTEKILSCIQKKVKLRLTKTSRAKTEISLTDLFIGVSWLNFPNNKNCLNSLH